MAAILKMAAIDKFPWFDFGRLFLLIKYVRGFQNAELFLLQFVMGDLVYFLD
jgi:hypothetical protein